MSQYVITVTLIEKGNISMVEERCCVATVLLQMRTLTHTHVQNEGSPVSASAVLQGYKSLLSTATRMIVKRNDIDK